MNIGSHLHLPGSLSFDLLQKPKGEFLERSVNLSFREEVTQKQSLFFKRMWYFLSNPHWQLPPERYLLDPHMTFGQYKQRGGVIFHQDFQNAIENLWALLYNEMQFSWDSDDVSVFQTIFDDVIIQFTGDVAEEFLTVHSNYWTYGLHYGDNIVNVDLVFQHILQGNPVNTAPSVYQGKFKPCFVPPLEWFKDERLKPFIYNVE